MLRDEVQPISVDDHVIEPPHVFVDHIAPKFRDRAPRIVEREGTEGWLWEERFYPLTFQGNALTRRFRPGEDGRGDDLYARRYEDMIPAAYDVHERVRAMDEDGVWAELLFPTFPRFGGTQFIAHDDPELALALVRAWNDWMIDEWCAAYPERFIPQTLVPLWDVPAAVAEIERCAAKGSRAVLFVENPHPLGLPSFPTGHWRPVFEACNATGLPLSMHIGTSSGLIKPSPETNPSVGIALCGINSMSALGDLIFSGAFNGLPDCRVALSEGGAGWVPYVLERLDYTWARSRYDGLENTVPPSEVFAEHVWVCVISDRYAIRNRDLIGVEKIMWEADFPHNDSNWPNSRKVLAEAMLDVPDDEAQQIAEQNARDLYRFPARMTGARLTVFLPSFAAEAPPSWNHLFDLARAADLAGIDRVVVSDHVVFGENLDAYSRPESGGVEGGRQPTGPDGHWLEPLTVLTAVAAQTDRVRLGTYILLAALRRPVVLAKQLATLDVISQGRVDLGVGIGWQREEYEVAGLDFGERGRLLDQSLEVCQTLWRETRASFDSPELQFEAIHSMPKPVQAGGVPVWVSGRCNPRVARRLARFGSGWIPWGEDAADPVAGIPRMRAEVTANGGDAGALAVLAPLPLQLQADRSIDLAATMDRVAPLAAAGVTDFLVHLRAPASFSAAQDAYSELVAAFAAATGR